MTGFPIGMGMGGRQDSRGISICLSEESWLSFYLAIILHFPPQERLLSISILSHRDPRPSGSPKISYPTIQYDRIDQHAPESKFRLLSSAILPEALSFSHNSHTAVFVVLTW